MKTATCRTSTGTVNLIGGGQHKGVIRAVDPSCSTRKKCGNFPSFSFSQKYGLNAVVASLPHPDLDPIRIGGELP
jgi:hypothetical protein